MDNETENEKILLRRNVVKLSEVITSPSRILRFFPCLNEWNKERILAKERSQGRHAAFQIFHLELTTRPGWFRQLVIFLRDEEEGNAELANLLDPAKEYMPEFPKYTKSTPLDELPYSVLEAISLLHSLSAINTWKTLAGKLGYTVGEIGVFEAKPDPVVAFYEHFSKKDSANLGVLLTNLKDLGREDVLSELEIRLKISVTDILNPTKETLNSQEGIKPNETNPCIENNRAEEDITKEETKNPHQKHYSDESPELFQSDSTSKKLEQQPPLPPPLQLPSEGQCNENLKDIQNSKLEFVVIGTHMIRLSFYVLIIAVILCFLITNLI